MNFKITNIQIKILEWISKKIVVQSPNHMDNIIEYYGVITKAVRREFYEDNKITLDDFLIECHRKSLDVEDNICLCCNRRVK